MMEAKDTVIPTPDHSQSVTCPHCGEESGEEGLVSYIREEQAEISFKAGQEHPVTTVATLLGYEAGIREVVEWIYSYTENKAIAPGFYDAWQAKLKEWGIDNG